jgi:hypothetical protein
MESKKEEVIQKVAEEIVKKEEEIEKKVDEAEVIIETTAEKIGDKLEELSKPALDILDKIDDNPQVAKALEMVAEQFDGREINCSCFSWLFVLRISRKNRQTPQTKPAETENKSSS